MGAKNLWAVLFVEGAVEPSLYFWLLVPALFHILGLSPRPKPREAVNFPMVSAFAVLLSRQAAGRELTNVPLFAASMRCGVGICRCPLAGQYSTTFVEKLTSAYAESLLVS